MIGENGGGAAHERATGNSFDVVAGVRDWREGLPVLTGALGTLREIETADALPLFGLLTGDEAARFVAPWPSTIEGFASLLQQARDDRRRGAAMTYAMVAAGGTDACGLVQVRAIEPGFNTALWTFALGSPYWGTGLFAESAALVLRLLFDDIGVRRLEARTAAVNGRGNGALRKIGAVREARLRRSFVRSGACHDEVLWSLLADDWRRLCFGAPTRVH